MGIFRDLLIEKASEAATAVTLAATERPIRESASKVANALDLGIRAVDEAVEGRGRKKDSEYVAERPSDRYFYIRKNSPDDKPGFAITDLDGRTMFLVTGILSKHMVSLKVKNGKGRMVGEVKKRQLAIRNPRKHEENPADFDVYYDGKVISTVKTTLEYLHGYIVEPQGWEVCCKTRGYTVQNDAKTLFYLDERRWHSTRTFIIDCLKGADETVVILIGLAMAAHICWSDLVNELR